MPELVLIAIIAAFIWWAARHGEPGKGTHVGDGADIGGGGGIPDKPGWLYRRWAEKEYGLSRRGWQSDQDKGEL